eukprot:191304_1
MDCPNCKNKFTLCRGKKYPTCEACGQPYCTVDCINFHKEEHIESTQCKNKQDRELIAQIYDKLSRDYQWRCKEMIVLAISPVVYTNRKHLPSVRMDRDLIYNMYGPYGMNWHLIRSVSDFVSKNMVDRMILRVCEFIEKKNILMEWLLLHQDMVHQLYFAHQMVLIFHLLLFIIQYQH